jgi:hypothetical protein
MATISLVFFLRSTGRTGLEGQGDPIRNGQGAKRKKALPAYILEASRLNFII